MRGEIYLGHDDFRALNDAPGGGWRKDVRQSAQRSRGLAAPARCRDHGDAAAQVFCLYVGGVFAIAADTQTGVVAAFKRWGLADQSADAAVAARTICSPTIARSARSAQRSATISTASSTRWTGSICRSGSGSCRARRAGPSRTSFRPSRRRRSCATSKSRSGARAR